MLAQHDDAAPRRVDWPAFLGYWQRAWRQGEHVALIGPTGSGKTTLAKALLPRRKYVAVLATKPRDASLDALRRTGYQRIVDWPPPAPPNLMPRVLVWPRVRTMADAQTQRAVFGRALRGAFTAGNWCVFADELRYLTETLALKPELQLLWLQGRSVGVSIVGATQRPAFVPLELYDQSTHLFFWRDRDRRNLDRIGGINSLDPRVIRDTVARLDVHDVLYVNSHTGDMATTRCDP